MTSGFGLIVRFTLHGEEAAEAFDALVERTLTGIQTQEPGTLAYVVHTVEDDPNARIFYELYEDRAAFDRHERMDHTRHFLSEREQHIQSLEVTFMQPMSSAGTVLG
ncbi:putative quinol monooxygenase [Streptomyces sp. NBC_00690]|uniref:putative quinol monooxygenase n=1 Tax=Streptomyces sp. NBC_00690 TaxID=2975808 RepID=UPI002E280653|nr:antibiotic biosynthesis monooxygenase [Streptomyces sp. NBC_00690]